MLCEIVEFLIITGFGVVTVLWGLGFEGGEMIEGHVVAKVEL